MATTTIKPSHKAIQAYYDALRTYQEHRVRHETALETAFQRLLADTGRLHHWTLVPKLHQKKSGKSIYPDGTLQDDYFLPRGYWEAKDLGDNLDAEIGKKFKAGYPTTNITFENTCRAVLYRGRPERNYFFLADMKSPAGGVTETPVASCLRLCSYVYWRTSSQDQYAEVACRAFLHKNG